MAQREARLRIEEHNAVYRVPSTVEGLSWRNRLDDLLRYELPDRLRGALSNRADDGVWLIRSLNVYLRVGAHWTNRQIVESLSKQIADELRRDIDLGANGKDVLWFPSRAAYVGRFFADCAEGRAQGRWEYAQFSKWERLSPSAIVREFAEREPECTLDALANVLPGELNAILSRITAGDGDEILAFLAKGQPSTSPAAFPAAMESFGMLVEAEELPDEPRRAALALFLDAIRRQVGVASQELARVARDLGYLSVAVRARREPDAEHLIQLLLAGQTDGLKEIVGNVAVAQLASFLRWPSDRRQEALERLLATKVSRNDLIRPPAEEWTPTRIGGMFLLLPLLQEFPWEAATNDWPAFGDTSAARLLQYLTIIGALGRKRNLTAASDPLLRLALGIDPFIDGTSVARWAASITPNQIRRFEKVWFGHLATRGKIMAEEATFAARSRTLIAIDGERGLWTSVAPRTPRHLEKIVAGLRQVGENEPVWRVESKLGDLMESNVSFTEVEPLPKLTEEVGYVSLSPDFRLTAPLRRLLMSTAQNLLREFGWRLPGFSRSSLPHLYDNFLSFAARVQAEEDRYLVQVQNPPLHLVLSLTGMNRKSFRLDATGGKEWVLTHVP